MTINLIISEIKLTFRCRLPLLYFLLTPITLSFFIYYLSSKPENKFQYSIFGITFLIPFIAFMGSAIFCWYWGENYNKIYLMKRKLKKMIFSKILFVYIIQLISTLISIIIFNYLEYYFYLKIVTISAVNSLGFFTLFLLWLQSYQKGAVDLFDNHIFIVEQNIMNFLIVFVTMLLATLYYYIFRNFSFIEILVATIFCNIALLFIFYNKILYSIRKQIIKNIKK